MNSPAKTLAPADVRRLRVAIRRRRSAVRDEVIVLLSFKAGLRAGEIASLDWKMVLGANQRVADCIQLPGSVVKYGRGRRIPLHSELKHALLALHSTLRRPESGPVIVSQRGGAMCARSVVNWFQSQYSELGLSGCSSHSGRRTFITMAARAVSRAGGSLRDVQELAGHRALTTTERYIEGDRDAQRKLVRML
jgi:integrase/recombinase XerC